VIWICIWMGNKKGICGSILLHIGTHICPSRWLHTYPESLQKCIRKQPEWVVLSI
jgi:hypothetical protein